MVDETDVGKTTGEKGDDASPIVIGGSNLDDTQSGDVTEFWVYHFLNGKFLQKEGTKVKTVDTYSNAITGWFKRAQMTIFW